MHEALYKQHILDHYTRPRNKGVLATHTHTAQGHNVSCGDRLTLYVHIAEGVVCGVSFEGEGCAISQAAMSMLSERLSGRALTEVETIDEATIYALLGVEVTPSRRACALLGYTALQSVLTQVCIHST